MTPFYTEAGLLKLGQSIRRVRIERGLSQRQLAERSGVDNQTINRLERGKFANPSPDTLAKIAPHLGCTIDQFLAIASSKDKSPSRLLRTAEDVLPYLADLPISEVLRLSEILNERATNALNLEEKFNNLD